LLNIKRSGARDVNSFDFSMACFAIQGFSNLRAVKPAPPAIRNGNVASAQCRDPAK